MRPAGVRLPRQRKRTPGQNPCISRAGRRLRPLGIRTDANAWRYREIRTRGGAMTTLIHRAQGPDKKAAEMSDSDDTGHPSRASQEPAGKSPDPADRRQRAWV